MPITKFTLDSVNTDSSEGISLQYLIANELNQIIISMEVGAEVSLT